MLMPKYPEPIHLTLYAKGTLQIYLKILRWEIILDYLVGTIVVIRRGPQKRIRVREGTRVIEEETGVIHHEMEKGTMNHR